MSLEKSMTDIQWFRWEELTREQVKAVAPEAVVVIPLGAIEQHGPHLATGTDITLSTAAVEAALDTAVAESPRPFLLAPFLRIGCSGHHVPFGGTISLTPATMITVLVEAMLTMEASGVRRILLVNGHGGNTGPCHSAASEAASNSNLTIAAVDYWSFADADPALGAPGHAGQFETSLLLNVRPDMTQPRLPRVGGDDVAMPGRGVYGKHIWANLDGYTDQPELATEKLGQELFASATEGLSRELIRFARDE